MYNDLKDNCCVLTNWKRREGAVKSLNYIREQRYCHYSELTPRAQLLPSLEQLRALCDFYSFSVPDTGWILKVNLLHGFFREGNRIYGLELCVVIPGYTLCLSLNPRGGVGSFDLALGWRFFGVKPVQVCAFLWVTGMVIFGLEEGNLFGNVWPCRAGCLLKRGLFVGGWVSFELC